MQSQWYVIIGIIIVILAIVAGVVYFTYQANLASTSTLILEISSPKSTYNISEPLVLSLKLTNQGNQDLEILDNIYLENYPYSFDIINSTGNRVSFFGSELMIDYEDNFFKQLRSGESDTHMIDLKFDIDNNSPRYDLSEPGMYTITASYWQPYEDLEIVSNRITITLN